MYFDSNKEYPLRHEARLDGGTEPGYAFTDFSEKLELEKIFKSLNWLYSLLDTGRGGYYLYNLNINDLSVRVHIYIKRITFGGREKRHKEKRAQFSAGLDRAGYNAKDKELCLMLGIYKRGKDWKPVICAWDINDWGYNIGRAFNCFINVEYIAQAYKADDLVESRSAANQIVYSFTADKFYKYLEEKKNIRVYASGLENDQNNRPFVSDLFSSNIGSETVPNYMDLFQCIIDILKSDKFGGSACVREIESETAYRLKLSENARIKIHNQIESSRTELGYQLAWARTYLKLAGLIYSPERSFWALTSEGWQTQNIDRIDIITKAKGKDAQEEFEQDDQKIEAENGIEVENTDFTASEISYPFDASKVDIRTRTMSLDLILKRLDHEEIDVNTGFQRKSGLWDNGKQSRLIESILIRFPLPAFYFDGSNDDMWLVVDGLQRITALNKYVNKEEFGLTGLEFLTEYTGKKFSQLPGFLKRRIEEFEITAYIIAAGTPADLKYNLFKRINTGGLTLSDQEIRNALNQGTASTFIRELSLLPSFRLATDYSVSDDRMLDQEFVTRFLAFYMLDFDQYYPSTMDMYLNKVMSKLAEYQYDEEFKDKYLLMVKNKFDRSMQVARTIFGINAFRKIYRRDSRRNPINKALFDSWSVTLSKLSLSEQSTLIDRKEILLDKFIHLMNTNEDFENAVSSSTGDMTRIKRRFAEISEIVQSTLDKL